MAKKSLRFKDSSEFAWQGFELRHPDPWSPGSLKGDWKAGSVRFDDRLRVRMELEWKEAPEDSKVSPMIDRFVESLARTAKKERSQLQVRREGTPPWLEVGGQAEYFVWEALETVHTLALFSSASKYLSGLIDRPDSASVCKWHECFRGNFLDKFILRFRPGRRCVDVKDDDLVDFPFIEDPHGIDWISNVAWTAEFH